MRQILDDIESELDQAGQVSPVSPLLLKLDGCRITSETEVPKEEFLFRMFGKPCFPRRELSAVTGLEKCGKTFFTTMVLASCVQQNVLELERVNERPLKAMWFDTEQRVDVLGLYTDYASRFWGDPGLDRPLFTDADVLTRLATIKPQPSTSVRRTIRLDEWKAYGYKYGLSITVISRW